jgi:hypothetical protein
MEKDLETKIIDSIMDRALEIHNTCPDQCRDFRIMSSPLRKDTLILRWTAINLDNIDKPRQCFHYECFYPDGTPQRCSINYDSAEEANSFFWSLKTLYRQDFASDHK